ncbi:MAG: mandelate racemase/muconate lactonizing enzyme family protein [Candidatus Rokubacteria bacterium]|nr:mandelate racemase/muconate lactonizing enzyme family protein [Candidatus Rokubacteria bacterium]
MKVTAIETFVVDTGFRPVRPWLFCAVRTDAGLTGYGEFGCDGITRGLVGLVQDLAERLIGKDATAVEKHYVDMYRWTRQAAYGATQMAIAGIELALWDLAGKALGVPVWKLAGGPHRERQRVYWSHCATYRVENWELFRVGPLRTMGDVADCAREAVRKGYTALKTNIIWPGDPARRISQGRAGPHDQLATRAIVDQAVAQIGAMREAVGPSVDICLDVNVNFKPSEALLLARELEPFRLFWLEIDNQDPDALLELRAGTGTPICAGEQLVTVRQYRPYLERHAMDIAMVDVCWQGFSAARKVADLAEAYEINVAPHNYNGHLSTFQSLNLVASVSNVKIMESDPDAVPMRDELFTVRPEIQDGHMMIPTGAGWGTDLNEKAACAHAWQG